MCFLQQRFSASVHEHVPNSVIHITNSAKTFMLTVANSELEYNMISMPFLVVFSLHYIIIHLMTFISHF